MTDTDELFAFAHCVNQKRIKYFYPGRLPDGRQFLVLCTNDFLVGLTFSATGDLLQVEYRLCSRDDDNGESAEQYVDRFVGMVTGWHEEIGLEPATIQVKQFFLHDFGDPVGIALYTDTHIRLMEDPYRFSSKERLASFEAAMRRPGSGEYILWNGSNDLFMSDGRVIAT